MRRAWIVVAAVAMAGAAVLAFAGTDIKLPKCSMTMCRSVGCSPDVLCASGAHVKTCADVCNKN